MLPSNGGRRAVSLAAALLAGVSLLAACADSSTGSGGGQSTSSASSGGSTAGGVASLPTQLQAAYTGLDQPVGATPLATFKASKPKPWTIGYASSYDGNTWRQTGMDRLMNTMLPEYQKAGIIKDVIVTQSNLNDATQIQQIRQLADQGVDAILVCCSSISALNEAVKYAWDKGIPTFSYSGYLTSPYSLNMGSNYRQAGEQAATWMADKLQGKGSVLNVQGIPGAASSDQYDAGVKTALAKYPGIKVVGDIAGKWTDPVAKAETLKFLATYQGKVDGVIVQSGAESGVIQAFQSAGRAVPMMTLAGEASAACYWLHHPEWGVDKGWHVWPPGDEMQFAFESIVRTLEGQGPKIQSIIRSPAEFTLSDVQSALGSNCSETSSTWLQPGPNNWMPASTLDGFFTNPADPLKG